MWHDQRLSSGNSVIWRIRGSIQRTLKAAIDTIIPALDWNSRGRCRSSWLSKSYSIICKSGLLLEFRSSRVNLTLVIVFDLNSELAMTSLYLEVALVKTILNKCK